MPGFRGLQPRQVPLATDHLLLGRLADGAGVDHHEVRLVERGCLVAACRKQPAGHLLGVAVVHLAAERPDVEARQSPRFRAVLREALVSERRRRDNSARPRRHADVENRQLTHRHEASLVRSASATDAGTLSVACASA